MEKTYFMGPLNTCFTNSLMNLLLELDDWPTALKIPLVSRDSPLRASDLTINPMLLPRAVREFTSGKYHGTLHANLVPNIESALRDKYDDGRRDFLRLVRIVREEIEQGNIRSHQGLIPRNPPELHLIESPDNSHDLHTLVLTKEGRYIEEGLLLTKEQLESLGYDLMPTGVLHVERKL